MSDPKTTPVARKEAEGRNPGDGGETGAPDSAALHPGYGAMSYEGWECRRIGEIFKIGSGEAAAYRSNDFSGPVIVYGANGPIGSHDESNFGPGYLIGRVGAAGFVNRVSVKVWASDNTLTLVPITDKCEPNFAGFLLEFIDPQSLVTKTAQPLVTQTGLANVEAFIPTRIEEQRRIAEILDTLDNAIQKTEQLIAKLKQIKQGLLHDLLTRGIDENGQLRDPIAHPEQFKDSVLGKIPTEWDIKKVSEICHLGRGRVISQIELSEHPGIYPVYSSQSKDGGVFGYIDTYDFEGDYVTWTTDGAYAGTVFYRKGKFNCTNVCGTLRARSGEILMEYLAIALARETFKHVSYIGNPKLMNNTMAEIVIAVPGRREQEAIIEILSSHEHKENNEVELLRKYIKLKKGLMHDLLTGKVRAGPNAMEEQASSK